MPPSPPYRVEPTHQALEDIADIKAFTIERFGREQWHVYRQRIDKAIELVRTNPKIGKDVSDISPGLYRYHLGRPKGAHYLYYRVNPPVIQLVRILYERMDAPRHFPDPDED